MVAILKRSCRPQVCANPQYPRAYANDKVGIIAPMIAGAQPVGLSYRDDVSHAMAFLVQHGPVTATFTVR